MKANFSDVRIAGILGVVPKNTSYFDDEVANYSHSTSNSKKLKSLMGYGEHRVVKSGVTTSDLAIHGLNMLFLDYGVDVKKIDAIFFISQTPDYVLPATSSYIHGKFAFLKDTYCVDINDGCNGYIKGLYEAGAFLSATNSQMVLLIAGDVLSPKISINDRNSYPLVGDAVTITLVEKAKNSPMEIEIFNDGTGYDKLMIPAGGARMQSNLTTKIATTDDDGNARNLEQLVMQGRDVFTFTQTVIPEFIDNFLKCRYLSKESIDLFILHQANVFILDRIRARLKIIAEKLPDEVVKKFGNSSSATIPLSIIESYEDHKKNKILR